MAMGSHGTEFVIITALKSSKELYILSRGEFDGQNVEDD
jgi:hypothetical protein